MTRGQVRGGRLGSLKAAKDSLKSKGDPRVRMIPGEDSITVRFLENPEDWYGFYEHWMKDGPIPCTEGDCVGCESDNEDERRKTFRYLANAYVVDDSAVKVIKLPKSLAEILIGYYEKKGTLFDRDYELSKTGSGKNDTKYMAAPDSPSKKELSRFQKQLVDHESVIDRMLGQDDADEEEDDAPPTRSRKSSSNRPPKSSSPWDDDEDEDDEDDAPPPPRRSAKRTTSTTRKPAAKSTTTVRRSVRRSN